MSVVNLVTPKVAAQNEPNSQVLQYTRFEMLAGGNIIAYEWAQLAGVLQYTTV